MARPTRAPTNEPPIPHSSVIRHPMGWRPGTIRRPRPPTISPVIRNPITRTSLVCPVMVEVVAEIAANVWQVPAEVGQMVAEGDTIAILESMKMEIPVVAPVSGTVTELRVAPDDQVNEGDLIAVIDDS